MNKYVLTALLCPILGSPAAAQTAAAASPSNHRMGAYEPAPTDTPLVQEARTFIQRHLASFNLDEVTEAYTQVVAGFNVKLVCKVTAEDGPSAWQFVAYRSLDGQWHFWSADRL